MRALLIIALLTTVAYAAEPLPSPLPQTQNIGAVQMQEAVAEALTDEINSNIRLRSRVLQLQSDISDLKKQIEELKKAPKSDDGPK